MRVERLLRVLKGPNEDLLDVGGPAIYISILNTGISSFVEFWVGFEILFL